MKNISIAVAAMSAMSAVAVAQPSFAAHRNLVHVQGHGRLELGDLFSNCCGGEGNTASAEIVNIPQKGFGAQLQVTQPNCCDSSFAETGIRNIDGTKLLKTLRFTVTGLGTDAPPTANFGVFVVWTPTHGSTVSNFFTVANGGLSKQGNQFVLSTGARNGIAAGSTLNELDFELDGNCVAAKQTAFIQNVFLDKSVVNYQLDSASAFCGGCS